ncbi:tyrosine-protein phosphatase [Cellulosimicrobium protaetiae]|uniref:Tyrosine-protein phosphatase n=1 Tax=Cellulosimicrobium protaetiae TaxID=2587808 RepID=A0A6M5UGV5_9MICO|nr:tyrosine-protein phosphatase [Cellulosimicrobium protaetiae]QJW36842.1 tyrosine-protein phosphatase [Cellulosimicrobium protaetiae]
MSSHDTSRDVPSASDGPEQGDATRAVPVPEGGAVPGALDVPGTWNARDVGGRAVPAGSAEPLRTGVLLRTASLSRLTPAGQAALGDLGVTTVLDLRGDDEVERDGADAVPGGVRVLRRGMDPAQGLGAGGGTGGASADPAALVAGLLSADDPAAVARRMMHGVYATFVQDPGIRATVGRVLGEVASSEGTAVVHCSAGKDRTGWVVALAQYVAGVAEEDRLAEYLASRSAVGGLAALVPPIPGLSPDALAPVLTVEPEYLEAAWALAAAEHGSVDGYLVACGVTAAVRDALVARLVAS